jgi:hypothetical protein
MIGAMMVKLLSNEMTAEVFPDPIAPEIHTLQASFALGLGKLSDNEKISRNTSADTSFAGDGTGATWRRVLYNESKERNP